MSISKNILNKVVKVASKTAALKEITAQVSGCTTPIAEKLIEMGSAFPEEPDYTLGAAEANKPPLASNLLASNLQKFKSQIG